MADAETAATDENKGLMAAPASDDASTTFSNIYNEAEDIVSRQPPRYSVTELVQTLGNTQNIATTTSASSTAGDTNNETLPAELQRRCLDFHLAQRKRREKYGEQKKWGVFGMYIHLSNVRIDLEWAEDAAWRRQNGQPYLSWSDFDQARVSGRNRPWFTYTIVLVCTAMLIVEFALNEWKIEPLSVNPMAGPSRETLITIGARDTTLIINNNEWYRLFSPLILHAGIIHYVVNMIALWFIGAAVEISHGFINTAILFIIPGVGGNILSAIFLPEYITVGASGGIFGLIGGCLADIGLNWSLLFIKTSEFESDKDMWKRNFIAVFFLFTEIIINVMLGLVTPFIDNWTHLGGLVYGICCGLSTLEPLAVGFFGVNTTALDKIRKLFIKFCGLIISVLLIIVSIFLLASSDPEKSPCPGCRYMSCVPFPFFTEKKWWYCDDCDFVSGELYKQNDTYSKIELSCPDDVIETIDILQQNITSRHDIEKNLPTYCRDFCDSVFA